MQERKTWEDLGWPQWLLRPVKLQRLKDVLGLINQEHRLDSKTQITKGTEPEKSVPKKVDISDSTKSPAKADSLSQAPLRALVVDDNLVNQKLSSKFLQKLGCEILVVDNGQKAVHQVTESNFDIVFMDCQMPVMDGYEATKSIRALGDTSRNQIPVIAMTANVMEGDRQRCLAAGMNDYITKPFKSGDFQQMLEKWAARS